MPNVITGQPWSVYYPDVRIRCPGVPEPIMDHALRETSRDFLRRTLMWQMLIGPQDLAIGGSFNALTTGLVGSPGNDWPTDTGGASMERVAIIRIYLDEDYGGAAVQERSTQWLDQNLGPSWPFMTGKLPQYWFSFDSSALGQAMRYVPSPSEVVTDAVWITAALSNPIAVGSATTALDFDFNPELPFRYKTEIAAGAIARLATMMDGVKPYPWTNPALSLLKSEEFEVAISKMKIKVAKSGTRMTTIAPVPNVGFA